MKGLVRGRSEGVNKEAVACRLCWFLCLGTAYPKEVIPKAGDPRPPGYREAVYKK